MITNLLYRTLDFLMDQTYVNAASVAQGQDPLGAATHMECNNVSLPAGILSGLAARPLTGPGGEPQSGARPRASTPFQPPRPTLPTPLSGRGTSGSIAEENTSETHSPLKYTEAPRSTLDHITPHIRRETNQTNSLQKLALDHSTLETRRENKPQKLTPLLRCCSRKTGLTQNT